MMVYKPSHETEGTAVYLQRKRYHNGNVSLTLIEAREHYPYATCTVNVDGLEEGEVAIKNYSENTGMLNFLISEGIIEPPHRSVNSGYVRIPICKVK
jgi:hypothetical protein